MAYAAASHKSTRLCNRTDPRVSRAAAASVSQRRAAARSPLVSATMPRPNARCATTAEFVGPASRTSATSPARRVHPAN